MKYDTKEEIEKTGEWLVRINQAGNAEPLMYLPSELTKWGIAQVDVVNSLEELRRKRKAAEEAKHQAPEPAPEPPAEDGGTVETEPQPEEPEASEPDVPVDELGFPLMEAVEPQPLVLDYDMYGLWEWMEPIERMVEEAMKAVFIETPGSHAFNQLASESRLLLPEPSEEQRRPRRRGRAFRAALAVNLPHQRAEELASSSGATT